MKGEVTMCESESQGIENRVRGHYLQRLRTLKNEGIRDVQGEAMVRGVLNALADGVLFESDFSDHGIVVSEIREAVSS